jgi:RNA polymerase sigma-70 factor (ECF subfamily)
VTQNDNTPPDRELILQLQSGKLEVLGDLYDRYRSQIYHTALAITHDQPAAEDILQECFLRVYKYAHRINVKLPLAPWLYRVTVNLSYTWAKKRKRLTLLPENLARHLSDPFATPPEVLAERMELRQRIQDAIDALPFNQKVVIVLYYLNGLNLKEIAEIVRCPVGTVKSRLFHARTSLRKQIAKSAWANEFLQGYT